MSTNEFGSDPTPSDPTPSDGVAPDPFFLDYASQGYLAGDDRGIRHRLAPDQLPLQVFSGIVLAILGITVAQQGIAFSRTEGPQPTIEGFLGTLAALIGGVVLYCKKFNADSAKERLIREGQILKGTVLHSEGNLCSYGSEGVVGYQVTITYQFVSPAQNVVTNQWGRDRDELQNGPLPAPGTEIRVLYLDDSCYVLL